MVFTAMGFDVETSLEVTKKEVSYRKSSLFGKTCQVIPLPSVSRTHCGCSKSLGYLIVGVFFIFVGILWFLYPPFLRELGLRDNRGAVIGLLIGIIYLIAYWLSKRILFIFETSGGTILKVIFKRSIIENVPVHTEKVLKAIRMVNQKVTESQTTRKESEETSSQETFLESFLSPQYYRVVFSGKIRPDKTIIEVKENLIALFDNKYNGSDIDRLFFSGKSVVIKNKVDYQTALKLQTYYTTYTGAIFTVEEI